MRTRSGTLQTAVRIGPRASGDAIQPAEYRVFPKSPFAPNTGSVSRRFWKTQLWAAVGKKKKKERRRRRHVQPFRNVLIFYLI